MVTQFFNKLGGKLKIELTDDPVKLNERLANIRAPANAQIVSLRLESYVFTPEGLRPLTTDEFDAVAFDAPEVRLTGAHEEGTTSHDAPNGKSFRVRDLLAAVEEHERQTRGASKWFDGIDVHHVFFEGLRLLEDGSWRVGWGS